MLGFSVPAMFVGFLHWPRGWFVLPYALAGLAYVFLYVRWTGIDLSARLRRHWLPGTLAGVAVAVFVVVNVLAQPASPTPTGLELIGALLWLGVLFVSGRRCVNSTGQQESRTVIGGATLEGLDPCGAARARRWGESARVRGATAVADSGSRTRPAFPHHAPRRSWRVHLLRGCPRIRERGSRRKMSATYLRQQRTACAITPAASTSGRSRRSSALRSMSSRPRQVSRYHDKVPEATIASSLPQGYR
jgi:hypothetical protein